MQTPQRKPQSAESSDADPSPEEIIIQTIDQVIGGLLLKLPPPAAADFPASPVPS